MIPLFHMSPATRILICFAVSDEAALFRRRCRERANVTILLTGMGHQNAEKSFRSVLEKSQPELVITSGFAGALDPVLSLGTVVFEADDEFPWMNPLVTAGARSVRFHSAEKVIVLTSAKHELWHSTKAQAVEMESSFIRAICRQHRIPSATVRVISDTANEDLPLDFNHLMTPDLRLSYFKLAVALCRSPGKIPELLRFQRRVQSASEKLAAALIQVVDEVLRAPLAG
jgi:adenosylhomocysteine nucleosidase